MTTKYGDCVKQHLLRANKDQIRTTFDQILNLVRTLEAITVSPQVRALYVQIIITTVNESDSAWSYNPGNIADKIQVTGKMLLNVPEILVEIRNAGGSNFITASKFLHYGATHLDLWCPFEKPTLFEGQASGTAPSSNVTSIDRSRGKA